MVGENAVGVIGPGDKPRVSAAVTVGQRPSAVAGDRTSVWVTNSTADSVSRIDPEQNVSVPTNLEAGSAPSGISVGAGAVWVANSGNSTVSRIDPATSRMTAIPVRPGPTGIVVAFGSVWVTNALDAKVSEIDPETNKVVKVVPVGAGPTGIAAGAGYLWVTNRGDGTVTRFHPETYVADPAVKVGSGPSGIAVGGGAAWVANNLDGALSRIDVEDLSVTSRTLVKGGGAYGVAAHGGNVWVSNQHAGTLMRVTARTFRLGATVRLGGAPLGLTFVGDDLWFTSAAGGSALHRGGVLTMVGSSIGGGDYGGEDPPLFDPTADYYEGPWRLAALTNDGPVGFRRAGGVDGAGLVPDLATALPTPTDNGLTYTFHLRKGVRYSTGAPVLAGDIRRGMERAVGTRAATTSGPRSWVRRPARTPRTATCIRASRPTTGPGTVTFHLTKPTPDFLYLLTLPTTSAVAKDTPPLDLTPGSFVPATGPYMIRSYTPKQDATGGRPSRHGRSSWCATRTSTSGRPPPSPRATRTGSSWRPAGPTRKPWRE